jgi:hypothetical protein
MLGDRRCGDLEGLGEFGDRRLARRQAREDAPADGMGQGAEGEVEPALIIVNHLVKYNAAGAVCQAPRLARPPFSHYNLLWRTPTMNERLRPVPKTVAAGACLALLAILFGFVLGGAFGAVEDRIKGRLEASGSAVVETVYKGDAAAKDAVVKKSWSYLTRAHLHGGAIGTAALASIGALILLTPLGLPAQLSALAFGAGALLYAAFWLIAGFIAPGMEHGAAESLAFIAIPGAGLCLLGACGTLSAWRSPAVNC